MPRLDIAKIGVVLPVVLIFFLMLRPCYAGTGSTGFQVRYLRFEGVKQVNKNDLAATLAVKLPPAWKFWAHHPVVNMQDIEDDQRRIKQYYQDHGYYHAAVTYTVIPVDHFIDFDFLKKTGAINLENQPATPSDTTAAGEVFEIDVIFKITEGPPVIVRNVTFDCLCEIKTISEDQLKKQIPVKTGRIFNRADYEQSKSTIKNQLGNRAYPFAVVSGQARVDLDKNLADITFNIDPGDFYYFGQIRFSGHKGYVRQKVLQRAITFHPGERFSAEKLNKSRRNLFDLGVFKTALITTENPNPEDQTVPILVQIKPRKRHNVELGVGYGTEDGLRLRGAWAYRNLTGNADRLSFNAKRTGLIENIEGRYLLPYFLSARNNLTVTSGFEREKSEYYTLRRVFSEVNLNRRMKRNLFSSIGYNLEVNRPEDIKVAENDLMDSINDINYRVSSTNFSIEHNTVADALNPKKGSVVSLSFEEASGYLGSEVDYIKPMVEAKAYLTLPWNTVLAGRARLRTVKTTEDTLEMPIYKQLFLGGSKTVRGYAYQKLGRINNNGVPVDVAGLSSFCGSLELRYPIYGDFSGVAFLDMGVLDDDSFRYNFNNMQYTCGLGLRYNTVIGPIQLDFGYKLNPPKRADGLDPDLADIANADRWRIHLNIGQAF